MKKYLNVFCLGAAALFLVLVFATMAGAGVTATLLGTKISYSIYELLDDQAILLVAMIFVIVAICAIAFGLIVELGVLKFEFVGFVLAGACLFAFLACIFYFLAATGDFKDFSLGAGAIFSALFSLLGACGAGFVAVKRILKK